MNRRSVAEIERLQRNRDRFQEFPCEGLRVGRLWLDQGFALELHPSKGSAKHGALLRIFLDFQLRTRDGEHHLTAHDHAGLTPAFPLLGLHVERAFITSQSGFELHLGGPSIVIAGSLDLREYWDFEQPWSPSF